jgi:hypothetical protein
LRLKAQERAFKPYLGIFAAPQSDSSRPSYGNKTQAPAPDKTSESLLAPAPLRFDQNRFTDF